MPEITEVGVAGILVILLLREILPHLSKKNGKSNVAGAQSVEFWQKEMGEITEKAVAYSLAPFLSNQTEILRQIERTQLEMRDDVRDIKSLATRLEGRQ